MKNTIYIIKRYIFPCISLSFLMSIIAMPSYIKLETGIIMFETEFMDFSILGRVLFFNYKLFFLFLIFLVPSFLCILISNIKFIKTKITVQRFIFSFSILMIILGAFVIRSKLLSILPKLFPQPVILTLAVIFLYLLSIILVLLIYRVISKINESKILSIYAASMMVALIISVVLFKILDEKFTSPITKDKIFLFVIFLIVSIFTAILSYKFIVKLLLQVLNKISSFQLRKISLSIMRIFFALIILNICVSIFGLFLENRRTSIDYIKIHSKTKGDVNIILIVIDALRADHLGCYGYERQTSPNIDAFASEGIIFKNCRTQASWTKPSIASILTTLYPSMHCANFFGSILPDELNTLPEILKKEGFITYGYVANIHLKSIFNFNQGFDFFDDYLIRDKIYYMVLRNLPIIKRLTGRSFDCTDKDNIELANQRILPWLERYKDENFFMYLHYMDPHSPYSPISPYKELFSYSECDKNSKDISLYDGEIRFVDAYLGNLFKKLKQLGIFEKTMIIITSDHGEVFGEHHDYEHGNTIYEEQLRVPLIIRFPSLIPKKKVINTQIKSIDIMSSILDMLNISSETRLEGCSFFPLINNNSEELNFNEYIFIEENFNNNYKLKGLIYKNKWKYIFTEKSKLRDLKKMGQEELYNLIDDPKELNNLVEDKPEMIKILRNKLIFYEDYCKKRAIPILIKKLDPETKRQLKSLGYIK